MMLVAIYMIGFIILSGDYAFAEGTLCVPGQLCSQSVERATFMDSSQQKQSPCLPGQPCFDTSHLKLLSCLPGKPCIGGQRPPIEKDPPNPPASKNPNLQVSLILQ